MLYNTRVLTVIYYILYNVRVFNGFITQINLSINLSYFEVASLPLEVRVYGLF